MRECPQTANVPEWLGNGLQNRFMWVRIPPLALLKKNK
jgi:hypothetical protein